VSLPFSRGRWRAAVATLSAAGLAALGLTLTGPAQQARATTYPTETPSWGAANLLSYDDSDFENGQGTWGEPSGGNASVTQDTTTAFLHNASLLMTAGTAGTGTQAAQAMNAAPFNVIPVTAGDTYRLSAWVLTGTAVSNRTVTFSAGFRDSAGNFVPRVSAASQTLKSNTQWQYVSGTIQAPAGTVDMAFPRITEAGGVIAGETLNVDEVMITPDRAAVLIGAKDPSTDGSQFQNANTAIGPLQVDKVFEAKALPTSYNGSECATVQQSGLNVTCVYNYSDPSNTAAFVKTIPPGENVILVYLGEPELKGGCCGGASSFVSLFEKESGVIRSSVTSANKENVFVAEDSDSYAYRTGGIGTVSADGKTLCPWIVPSSSVDFYLDDLYMDVEPPPNGGSINGIEGDRWNNWIYCVTHAQQPGGQQLKPVGLGEYGLNGTNSPNYANDSTTYQSMSADNSYLEAQSFEADNNGVVTGFFYNLPVVDWMYWWYNNNPANCGTTGNPPCSYPQFTSAGNPPYGQRAVQQWQANETLNGGGAN
jgi:hypothetical protein